MIDQELHSELISHAHTDGSLFERLNGRFNREYVATTEKYEKPSDRTKAREGIQYYYNALKECARVESSRTFGEWTIATVTDETKSLWDQVNTGIVLERVDDHELRNLKYTYQCILTRSKKDHFGITIMSDHRIDNLGVISDQEKMRILQDIAAMHR